jgi:NADP-dependent 3-hydroxy acid dehydrogenase YdfG
MRDQLRAIVTGASKGIGKATAILLAEHGHKVVAVSRNRATWMDEYADIEFLACDVKDHVAVKAMVDEAEQIMGGYDTLINNAGLGYFDPLVEGKIEHWHNTIDTNVKGLLNCIHASLPNLIKSKGQIINLGSVASHQVFANSGVYCASKWAVLAISESIKIELEGKVRVTTISPGGVNTEFIDNTVNEELLADMKPYFATALDAKSVAAQIVHAAEAPKEVVLSEIIVRPSRM